MGLAVLPPDINASDAGFTVDGTAIRFGLAGVKNVGDNAIAGIVAGRAEGGKYTSIVDFCSLIDMRVANKRMLESLIKCGAFDSLGWKRSQLLAVLDQAVEVAAARQRDRDSGQLGLFGDDDTAGADEIAPPRLEELPAEELLAMEKEITGFYVTGHPLDKYRETMKSFTPIGQLAGGEWGDGQAVRVAGLVASAKRITTKSGDMMCFLGLEDFTGQVEVVVFPRLFERISRLLLPDAAVAVGGRLSVGEETVKIIADDVAELGGAVNGLANGGAGFRKPREVRLRVGQNLENDETFDRLKEVFARHQGAAVVFLHFTASRRVVRTDKQYWLEPSPEAVSALEAVLGPGTVQVS
jgi:DNA polymerase-3 subunit alpha